ncbi:hypothetical protein [Woodsholea maritima]|uniref:hypothetical protein n=1 Tax=Woodsholea maritima TaxID=240237 RepID=UPI00035C26D6|nr:hypothetical protein [Woodsholea maritima]
MWRVIAVFIVLALGLTGCVSVPDAGRADLAEQYYIEDVDVVISPGVLIPVRYDDSVAEFFDEDAEKVAERPWLQPVLERYRDDGRSAISYEYLRQSIKADFKAELNQYMTGPRPARLVVNVYSLYFPDRSSVMMGFDARGARISFLLHEVGQDQMLASADPFRTVPAMNGAQGVIGLAIRAAVPNQHIRDLEDVSQGIVNDTTRLLVKERVPYHQRNTVRVYE